MSWLISEHVLWSPGNGGFPIAVTVPLRLLLPSAQPLTVGGRALLIGQPVSDAFRWKDCFLSVQNRGEEIVLWTLERDDVMPATPVTFLLLPTNRIIGGGDHDIGMMIGNAMFTTRPRDMYIGTVQIHFHLAVHVFRAITS